MNKYEENARDLKTCNNCSYSVYNAYRDVLNLSGDFPAPRSIDGKCGALLAALKVLEEANRSEEKEKFEEDFVKKFGYSKCIDLMSHEKRCSDYVGWSANKLSILLEDKLSKN